MSYKVYVLCYPRAASRFFTNLLSSKLGPSSVFKTHYGDINTKGIKIVGLIRNPIEQISSALAQGLEFEEADMLEMANIIARDVKNQSIIYAKTMDKIFLRSEIILDYDFMTQFPDKAAEAVLSMLGEQDLNLQFNEPETQIDNSMRYMKSSKESKNYEFIRSVVEKQDLSAAFTAYNKLLGLAYSL